MAFNSPHNIRFILFSVMNLKPPPGLFENVDLAPLTSFKAGGSARYFGEPDSLDSFKQYGAWIRNQNIPFFLLGKGSNVIFSDRGFSGLVLHCQKNNSIEWSRNRVRCQSGAPIYQVVRESVRRGLAGIQRLGGIPGSLGGAAYMNAGAYEQEFGDCIAQVRCLRPSGEVICYSHSECEFRYRHSRFWNIKDWILEVELELNPGNRQELEAEMRTSLASRKKTQPLNQPNSGSVFKRLPGIFPGKIIEDAGLKGLCCGGARVSEKHANFILNSGGASAQDFFDLSEQVRKKVDEKFGVKLQREVLTVGEFLPWPR